MNEWYILPGMGASSEMYDSLKRQLCFKVNFINWPAYRNELSYREVAERIIIEHRINDSDIVGGSSLGGMVALEIAMILDTRAVVLLGSAFAKSELKKWVTLLSPLATITPFALLQQFAGKNKNVVARMFSKADPDFMRSMGMHLTTWPGYVGTPGRVFRIHGEKDRIIDCPRLHCKVVKNAGHLLAITHAKECSEFLEKIHFQLATTSKGPCCL